VIEIKKEKNLTIVRLKEKRFDSSKAPLMKTEFLKLISDGTKNILLNLEEVESVDSSGLGSFNFGKRQLNGLGGDMKLCQIKNKVNNLLKISKLDRVYKVFNSEEEGIKNFFSEK
jgi:anti-anti-sigma factor